MSTRINRKEYRRVKNEDAPAKEKGQAPENEIRVTAGRRQGAYISYAIALLTGTEDKKKFDAIKVSAMGEAIFNAVNICEIVKRRVKGVHSTIDIASETVHDKYEKISDKTIEEVERKVSTILITLSTKPLDKKHVGYQQPIPEDQVTEQEERPKRSEGDRPRGGRGGRGSGRGGRGGRGGGGGGDKKPEGDSKPAGRGRGGDKKPEGRGRGARGGRQ